MAGRRSGERGFTIVELLIVVVILGVLSGLVVFAVGNLAGDAAAQGCVTEAERFGTAVRGYRTQNVNALPDGDLGGPTNGTLAEVAAVLAATDLLNSANTRYGGVTPGWSYDSATGRVETSGCP